MLAGTPIQIDGPVNLAMDVLRLGGIRPSWLGEAHLELELHECRLPARMRCYPVSTRINPVVNDDAECSRPVELAQIQDGLFQS